ncbi:LysR family transcriptional regulator [Roseovarius sp. EL26]|uniref:LysR family transcriptional regulator n=1 Tax=Roseovarius sp. EL26 TaxID=2126672 RepID=UPI000EA21009|nr:LysR family transcriptional regulator [Roseovarius sp. EL26]
MPSHDSLQAFVLSAELGSFSAAARRLGKAQSAVSTAIANLEIDTGLILFDRSSRSPTLTKEGETLLPHAKGILLGNRELMAKATSMSEDIEDRLTMAIEQGLNQRPVLEVLSKFVETFPYVSLEILTTGPNDTATLLKEGRADLGLMTEQEGYPTGFHFHGVGHSVMASVCSISHPLADLKTVAHKDLREHRQIVLRSRSRDAIGLIGDLHYADPWYAESPRMIIDLLLHGLGWAELPLPVVHSLIASGELTELRYDFQHSDQIEGIDVVWTEQHALGRAGQWILDALLKVPQEEWRG